MTKKNDLLLNKLKDAGLSDEIATKVAKFIQSHNDLESTTKQKRAREIMGKNFFGVEEAIECFGVSPRSQVAFLSEVPFSEQVIEESKNTHILVAVFPLSIIDMRRTKGWLFSRKPEDAWYNKYPFARERGELGWQLVRKTPVANSALKNWQEQKALISKDEMVPSAQVVVYTIIGHYLATGERLLEKVYVRTSSVTPGGYHIFVGGFAEKRGLLVSDFWDDTRFSLLGIASAKINNV